MGVSVKTHEVPNMLNAIRSFKSANESLRGRSKSKILLEHIEAFFYMISKERVEMRQAQMDLDFGQAKAHRTFKHLELLGWVKIKVSPNDARQRDVFLTAGAKSFHLYLKSGVHFKVKHREEME
jgi:DNA-binding MarR family transcriptional regulator